MSILNWINEFNRWNRYYFLWIVKRKARNSPVAPMHRYLERVLKQSFDVAKRLGESVWPNASEDRYASVNLVRTHSVSSIRVDTKHVNQRTRRRRRRRRRRSKRGRERKMAGERGTGEREDWNSAEIVGHSRQKHFTFA